MRNEKIVIVVLFVLCFVLGAKAQHQRFGLIGGLNFADLNSKGEEMGSRTAYGFGGVLELGIGKQLVLCMEPMYLGKGAKTNVSDPEIGGISGEYRLSYIEIPVFFKWNLSEASTVPYLMAGPTFGFLSSSKLTVGVIGIQVDVDAKNTTKTLDYGLGFGAGIHFPIGSSRLFLEARYTLGLPDIAKAGDIRVMGISVPVEDGEVRTKGIQIMAGLTFPFGGK